MLGIKLIEKMDMISWGPSIGRRYDLSKLKSEVRDRVLLNYDYKITTLAINEKFLKEIDEQTSKALMRDLC